jgi:DNA-binding transcriptional regulator YiaG
MKDIFKEKCVMKKYIDNENLIRHPMINQQQTGYNIKMLRKKYGISVKSLSNLLEFESVQSVYNWESGKTIPSLENLKLLSELFEKSIEEILIYE